MLGAPAQIGGNLQKRRPHRLVRQGPIEIGYMGPIEQRHQAGGHVFRRNPVEPFHAAIDPVDALHQQAPALLALGRRQQLGQLIDSVRIREKIIPRPHQRAGIEHIRLNILSRFRLLGRLQILLRLIHGPAIGVLTQPLFVEINGKKRPGAAKGQNQPQQTEAPPALS